MNMADGNVAFKCTYNDGGEPGFVGFNGTCSKENIVRNVEAKRVWCSAAGNACRRFYDDGLHGRRPGHPCYESRIFKSWSFGPGTRHPGTGREEPIAIRSAREGKLPCLRRGTPNTTAKIDGWYSVPSELRRSERRRTAKSSCKETSLTPSG